MAGCVPCFIIPLLLFIFHRYIQPILLKYWNPWENKQLKTEGGPQLKNEDMVKEKFVSGAGNKCDKKNL